jgi:tetratricopeptide (TPR) repeat protein
MAIVRATAILAPACVVILAPAQETTPKADAPRTDADIEAFARNALGLTNPDRRKSALQVLRTYRFKSLRAKEREFVLYAQGVLEDRLGEEAKAAVTFHKLERTWPRSVYLPEAQIVLASVAVDHKHLKEAESRLKQALQADIPVENKRRAQELLLWTLVEQGRSAEGLAIVKALFPLPGNEKPTERGLLAMTEVLCAAQEREQAEATWKELRNYYPNSPLVPRADLAWARLLGSQGEPKAAADVFNKILTEKPRAPEVNEARLALATLFSEKKLLPKEMEGFPTVQRLLDDLKHSDRKGDLERRSMVVQLRVFMSQSRWKETVDSASQLREKDTTKEQTVLATKLRAEAFRAWTQESLDKQELSALLPYLDSEGIQSLAPPQRLGLASQLSRSGLSAAARTVIGLSPVKEREAIRGATLQAVVPGTQSEEVMALLPVKGEKPLESLRRAQALLDLHRWEEARLPLGRSAPGPERIAAVLSYLRRPIPKNEPTLLRWKEAEGWLSRSTEKGPAREPLVILVADLRAQHGDWKGALSLYPEPAASENRGWVALMRATCQLKLGHKESAKATLKAAEDVPGFKMERQTLGKQLGM